MLEVFLQINNKEFMGRDKKLFHEVERRTVTAISMLYSCHALSLHMENGGPTFKHGQEKYSTNDSTNVETESDVEAYVRATDE